MKRIKAACICQTLHFQLKEDLEHSIAVRLVREEVEHYKQALERNRTRHKIVDEAEQEDGSVACPLTVAQYHFGERVIKERFDKICTFILVLMVSKK